ncbi:chemotaxis protein histidine kinase CheA [Bradyrhizobium diazoefficiens]
MSAMDPTEVFRQEASELFEVLEGALLDLGLRPDDRELVDSAFRALHTIKGSGAMFGFDKVASFTHEFETAFDRVRKGEIKPTQELISVALAAKDYIRALIEDPQSTDEVIGEGILDDLKRFVSSDQPVAPVAGIAEAAAPVESKQAGWHLYLEFESHILRNGSNPLDLLEDLCKLGPCFVVPVTDGIPFLDEMEPEDCYLKWDVKLHAACDKDAIDDVFMFVQDEMKLTLSPLEHVEAPAPMPLFQLIDEEPAPEAEMPAPVVETAAAPIAAQPAAKAEPKSEPKPEPKAEAKRDDRGIATVRVQAERLDELMDRVGELVIAQARLTQLASSGSDLSIKMIAEEIERLASSLRDTTMGARMVPIGSLFGRFRRLIHDLSRDLSKPVEFVTTGEDTELDKTMIECLADPLVHLIRNAIDHGIEDTATRAANGKTEQGRIELAAVHSGAQVLVHREGQWRRPQHRAHPCQGGRAGPDCSRRRADRSRDPPVPVPPGLLDRTDHLGAVRTRRRHGRGQAHYREHARHHRPVDQAGPGHHRDAAPALDARDHRRPPDPRRRRPLHHSAVGGGGMRRADGRGRAFARPQFPQRPRQPRSVPAPARDHVVVGSARPAPEDDHHLDR